MQQEFIVNYFTLGLFLIVSIIFIPAIIFLTKFLAPHNPTDEKLITYECGVPPRGGIFSHFYIRYYIFAFIFFIASRTAWPMSQGVLRTLSTIICMVSSSIYTISVRVRQMWPLIFFLDLLLFIWFFRNNIKPLVTQHR